MDKRGGKIDISIKALKKSERKTIVRNSFIRRNGKSSTRNVNETVVVIAPGVMTSF